MGGSYGNTSPSAPTGSAAPPAGAVVIDVIGINGAQSFSPNPATVPPGQTVVWHNVDTVTHRVVFNDGEVDTGNMAPGAFSAAMGLVAPGPTTARSIRRWSAPPSINKRRPEQRLTRRSA